MELQTHICDDEVLLAERRDSPWRAKRALPGLCALTLLAAAGAGARVAGNSSQIDDAVSLSGVGVTVSAVAKAAQAAGTCDDWDLTDDEDRSELEHWRGNPNGDLSDEEYAALAPCFALLDAGKAQPVAQPAAPAAGTCDDWDLTDDEDRSELEHWRGNPNGDLSDEEYAALAPCFALLDAGKAQPVAQPAAQPSAQPTAQPATAQPAAAQPAAAQPAAQPVATDAACSFDGSDCRSTGCCARAGSKCYRKNDHWASCNETCLPFSRWSHHHHHWVHTSEPVWDCTVLTEPVAVAVAPAVGISPLWDLDSYKSSVYAGCPEDGHDCRYSRCCARRGSKCFVKNDHWASCNETCMPYTRWHGPHGHGSWKRTSYPVWDCADITTADNTHAVYPGTLSSR